MKKDYLEEGSMADTADLVVLGAYYGTGNKGWSIQFLLLCSIAEMSECFCSLRRPKEQHKLR